MECGFKSELGSCKKYSSSNQYVPCCGVESCIDYRTMLALEQIATNQRSEFIGANI